MRVENFAEIEQEFNERVFRMIYASMSTIDSHNRPRSRIVHPIWEGQTVWICTYDDMKRKDLERNPHVSLGYIGESLKPVYVECTGKFVHDLAERQRIWEYCKTLPEPMGFDPGIIWSGLDVFYLLKLTPWQINVYTIPTASKIWQAAGVVEV